MRIHYQHYWEQKNEKDRKEKKATLQTLLPFTHKIQKLDISINVVSSGVVSSGNFGLISATVPVWSVWSVWWVQFDAFHKKSPAAVR